MSDATFRRQDDERMGKLEKVVEAMRSDIVEIKTKINDGFSDSIQNTENKVNYIDERNREEHKLIMGKMDRIVFLWLGGSISVVGGVVFLIIKGVMG